MNTEEKIYRKLLEVPEGNVTTYGDLAKAINLKNGQETKHKDLLLKSFKCKNSEFDDNPEITAYIQAKDLTVKSKDGVFIFNGWMFSSSPSITPFDHPVYDVWLVGCY